MSMIIDKIKLMKSPAIRTRNKVPTKSTDNPIMLREVSEEELPTIREACKRVGIGIDDYLIVIKDALKAGKRVKIINEVGEEEELFEADHDKRLRAAMLGLEVEGYLRNKKVGDDNRKYTQINVSWGGDDKRS